MLKSAFVAVLTLAPLMALSPPAGRPPVGPLERHDPQIHEAVFEVTVGTTLSHLASWENYRLSDAMIYMPVIMQSTFSRADPDSITVKLWLEHGELGDIQQRSTLKEGQPMNMHVIAMPIDRFTGMSLRWRKEMRVQTWSSRLNDAEAMKLTWPRQWPEDVRDALRPQMYIESDDEIFKQTVERLTEGRLRLVPPYIAAKELIRYAGQNIQVTGGVMRRGDRRVIEGLNVQGAAETVRRGVGSPNDLVCVAVALLRAAEIPSRPVIGIERGGDGRTEFLTWAEVYLPDAGWVPFDPVAMRGIGPDRDVRQRWANFGTMRELNRRIPLSYHFIAPAAEKAVAYPAVWGWSPGAHGDPGSAQHINLSARHIRRGIDDPH